MLRAPAHRRLPLRLAVAGVLLVMAANAACSPAGESGPSVVAAVYPLAFMAEAIAGDAVDVSSLTPGAEPHDLELTPSQARSIAEAELVLYVGSGFQPAVEDAVQRSSNGLDVLELAAPLDAEEGHSEGEAAEDAEEHADEGADPHVWLDPAEAAAVAGAVLEEMVSLAPEDEEAMTARHGELVNRLAQLDASFTSALADCTEDTIVVSHEAFGYLTRRYDLQQVGISGLNPEQEPSPQRLAEVTRFVQENGIGTIYLERLVSAEVGQTLAEETGAAIAYLDPLEMKPERGDYFSAMRENLAALQQGLDCSAG